MSDLNVEYNKSCFSAMSGNGWSLEVLCDPDLLILCNGTAGSSCRSLWSTTGCLEHYNL